MPPQQSSSQNQNPVPIPQTPQSMPPQQPASLSPQLPEEPKLPLVLCIIAVCLFWAPIVGIIIAIVALIKAKKRPSSRKLIIVLAIIGILANIGMMVFYTKLGNSNPSMPQSGAFKNDCLTMQLPEGYTALAKSVAGCQGVYSKTSGNRSYKITLTAIKDGKVTSSNSIITGTVNIDGVSVQQATFNNPDGFVHGLDYWSIPLKKIGPNGENTIDISFDLDATDNKPLTKSEISEFDQSVTSVLSSIKL